MTEQKIKQILMAQREFFREGQTLDVANRLTALRNLKRALKLHEEDIYTALEKDLGKSRTESYMTEIGLIYSEIDFMLKHAEKFSREKRVRTPLSQAVSRSYVKPSPRGNVLIISPWNYPLMLTIDPLTDAIAAGNTAVIKPSEYAPYTAEVVAEIIKEAFPPEYVTVINGGKEENQILLQQKFDYIFFTGSQNVGREVLRKAAENLTPVSLELGGKSPCVVEKSADIKMAARRIVFGKFINCGQTCVAPDYICCDREVKEQLEEALKNEIIRQFGTEPLKNKDYGVIVNDKHYNRLTALLEKSRVTYGGKTDSSARRIEPTVLGETDWNSEIMKDEIFGPLLPVIAYDSLSECIDEINSRPHPLAFYIFSHNKKIVKKITEECPFGGGCVNDTIIHLATPLMGFGGVGDSGMGAYHGKTGFDTFSHYKSIVDKKTWPDLPLRYQPFTEIKDRMIKMFLK